jgi:tellurite resistance protein
MESVVSNKPSEEEERHFSQVNEDARRRLRAELDVAAQKAADARLIAASLSTSKASVIDRIQAMGFDADKARVFDLLPLVHVAWADGKVQASERRTILNILTTRGIESDSEAWLLIEALLEERPSAAFLDETLDILRDLVGGSHDRAASLVELSIRVAEAHGALFGLLGTVSDEERKVLEQIASALSPQASAEFAARISG